MNNSKYIPNNLKNIPVVRLNPTIVNGTYNSINDPMKKKFKREQMLQDNNNVRLNPLLYKVS
jgi:hypothetical protein